MALVRELATANNASRRAALSRASIPVVTAATPVSTAAHCESVTRRANPPAVIEHNPATGVNA
jgi:hypothetical protein